MKKPKLIYLKWEDACSNTDFSNTYEKAVEWVEATAYMVEQTGWLIKETDEYILTAEDKIEERNNVPTLYRNVTRIPKSLIRKRKEVKI